MFCNECWGLLNRNWYFVSNRFSIQLVLSILWINFINFDCSSLFDCDRFALCSFMISPVTLLFLTLVIVFYMKTLFLLWKNSISSIFYTFPVLITSGSSLLLPLLPNAHLLTFLQIHYTALWSKQTSYIANFIIHYTALYCLYIFPVISILFYWYFKQFL